MEVLIREFSETLISELALRDELEYEKELKNTFISLLLSVQNRRRQYHVEKKRNKGPSGGGKSPGNIFFCYYVIQFLGEIFDNEFFFVISRT